MKIPPIEAFKRVYRGMEPFRRIDLDSDPPIELLSKQARRRVVQHLMQPSTGQASLDELVDYLVDDTATGRATEPERLRIRLHHCDLPKLAAHSVMDYDPRTGDIRYLPNDRIEGVMERLECD